MLKPERMSKVFVVGPKTRLEGVVGKLHELKIAHFIEHKKDEFDLCPPLNSFDEVSTLLVQVRSLISHLKVVGDSEDLELSYGPLKKNVAAIKDEALQLIGEMKEEEDELAKIATQKEVVKQMKLVHVSPEDFEELDHVHAYFGTITQKPIVSKIERITLQHILNLHKGEEQDLIALFVDEKKREEVEKVLMDVSFSEIDTSIIQGLKGKAKDVLEQLEKKEEQLEKGSAKHKKTVEELREKHGRYLLDVERFLAKEADRAQCPLSFGATQEAFFLNCFVPKKQVDKLKEELQKAAQEALHIEVLPVKEEDEVPIKLNNPKGIQNFEFFTRIFDLPNYKEFDPTWLIAITFPIFMGFMLGDIVYGMIMFALFFWLRKKFPIGKDFFTIMMVAAVSTMFFGALFGEVLGFEPYHGLIVRTHDFSILMSIALLVGLAQVNFGLLLGFILELQNHGLWGAITHKVSWVLIQIGGYLFIFPLLGLTSVAPQVYYTGMGIFILGAFLLYKAEGFIGVMELPTIISHILSYARLMAVGLASVFIAVMVNDLGTFLLGKGILFLPLAIIAFLVGHTFAIALGILSPSLHAIRLHYVEFFTKFFKGGGREYEPFGAEERKSLL